MDVSIIIVNWNSKHFLQKCIQSIYNTTTGITFEVIVVDSGSFDGTGELIDREFPQVTFLQAPTNLGFARANNLAVQSSRGDTLLFLNPDTEVHQFTVSKMFEALSSLPNAGVLGVKILNSDESLQTSCVQAFPNLANQLLGLHILQRLFPKAAIWGKRVLYEEPARAVEVQCISGACFITSRQVFTEVGQFSEDFFLYFEDVDYCLKAARIGKINYYVPSVSIIHYGGQSSGGSHSRFANITMAESASIYFTKNHSKAHACTYRAGLAIITLLQTSILSFPFLWSILFKNKNRLFVNALYKRLYILMWCFGFSKKQA